MSVNSVAKQYRLRSVIDRVVDYRGVTPTKLGFEWEDAKTGIPAVSALNIKSNNLVKRDEMNYVSDALYATWMRQVLEPGDLLLTSEAPLGEMYIVKENDKLCLSQRVFGLRTKKDMIEPKYLYYCLSSSLGQYRLYRRSSGSTAKGIRATELMQVEIDLPELTKQKKISAYLDDKIAIIDNMLAAKNKTRKHLSELRHSIITEMIYPVSSINDLNDTDQLYRHLISQDSGTWGEDPNGINDVKCLRVADFNYEQLSHRLPQTARSIAPAHFQTKILKQGDILIEKSGGGEKTPVGRAVIVGELNEVTTYANFIDRLRFKNSVLPEYALFLLYAMYSGGINSKYIKQNTGIQNLDIKHYLMEPVMIPNIEKQNDSVKKIKTRLHKLDLSSGGLEESISYLKEYRSSLISSVMAGKVKV